MPSGALRHHAHRHSVLVVDDFDQTRDAIVSMLQVRDIEAVGAESGPRALDLFQAGLRPCVVLLDLRMPRMDGWETWQRMKAHPDLRRTSVVILSAEPADDARAKADGIQEFLRKPTDGRNLFAAIEKYCDRQRAD